MAFFLAFFGSLIILAETNIFGTANPQDAPEPMTYLGGLLGYSLISALVISLLLFYILSYYYDLHKYLYLISVVIIGVVGMILAIVLGKIFFDMTNFFVYIEFPVLIQITNECSIDKSCIKEINGLTYSLILGPIIGLLLITGSFISFKKANKI